jgi:multidrug resistance protein
MSVEELKSEGNRAVEVALASQVATTAQIAPTKSVDGYEVDLEPHEHPQNKPVFFKWVIVGVVGMSALCVTCETSAASVTESGLSRDFHVGTEVTILSVSLFLLGLGIGPLLTGPLSEVYGRNFVYRTSFALLTAFTFGVAFAPNIVVHLVFRFLGGFIGSSFLTVAGGSVSDLFENRQVGNAMLAFVLTAFVGPVLGPLYAGFVNQHLDWRWTYYIMIIWSFLQTVALFTIVPETYVPVLRKWKAKSLRKSTGDPKYYAPLDRRTQSMTQAIIISCYRPFQLVVYERMALLLNTWSALILGILYLSFQAFPIIFGDVHHFNVEDVGMTFIGIGIGMLASVFIQPYFNRYLIQEAEKAGSPMPPPEARLLGAEIGGVCAAISLWWLAFTTYPGVHWIVPILASVLFGFSIILVFTSVLTYLVAAYRPVAASAMASNSAMRYTFGACFPLFAGQMYTRLGTVGATALLAGLMTVAAPLPFIFKRIGPRIRATSRFANFRS